MYVYVYVNPLCPLAIFCWKYRSENVSEALEGLLKKKTRSENAKSKSTKKGTFKKILIIGWDINREIKMNKDKEREKKRKTKKTKSFIK